MAPPRQGPPDAEGDAARQQQAPHKTNSSHEPDEEEEEEDEGDEDDNVDDSSSDYSSVSGDSLPPIYAYGHRYHGSARVYIPNDESEDERLSLQHELYKLCLGGRLHDTKLRIESDDKTKKTGRQDGADVAPEPFHILDVGSGNGLWAVEAAERYPTANVLGVDLTSALLPKDVPPNLTFEISDVAEPWPPRVYDFIHIRNLVGGGVRDWEKLLEEAYAHLKPGGALEFTEIRPRFYDVDPAQADLPDGEEPTIGGSSLEYMRLFGEMCEAEGINFDPVPLVKDWFDGSGMESLRTRADWLPVRMWGNDSMMRRKGEILRRMVDVGLEIWTMMLFGKAGRKEDETRALVERVKAETRDPKLRSYFNLTFITARKPLDSDEDDEEDEDEDDDEEDADNEADDEA